MCQEQTFASGPVSPAIRPKRPLPSGFRGGFFVANKKQITNNGEIKSDEPVVYLNSTDDSGKARSQFTPHTIIEITEDATAEYNLDYINDIVSAVYSLSSSVKISFSNQKPILFEFEIIDAGVLRYYLAGLAIQ